MNCKECKYCKKIGYTLVVRKAGLRGGRAVYYCENPKVYQMKDEHGYQINNFIGYGDGTIKNSLKLKTSKKWCPLKKEDKQC